MSASFCSGVRPRIIVIFKTSIDPPLSYYLLTP
jgi:hypothetical protein